MPVVLRVGGFSFTIYPDDHDPPHVHVRSGGARVILGIESDEERDVHGMSHVEVWRAQRVVRDYRDALLNAWFEIKAREKGR